MITLHVAGKAVSWADAEHLFAETARTQRIEFRNTTGELLATTTPAGDGEPDWVRAITPEETARRRAGPFLTLDEYRTAAGQ
jgi:hypothetical protein